MNPFQLLNGRCVLKILKQILVLIDQTLIVFLGMIGQLIHDLQLIRRFICLLHPAHDHRGGELLEFTLGEVLVEIAKKDDFSLFSRLDPAVLGLVRLRENRTVRGPTPPSNRPTATVENPKFHIVLVADPGDAFLGLVKQPAGRKNASPLAAIAVPDHDFLESVRDLQKFIVDLQRVQLVQKRTHVLQIVNGLHQGDKPDPGRYDLPVLQLDQTGFPRQKNAAKQVRRLMRHGQNVVVNAIPVNVILSIGDHGKGPDHIFRTVRYGQCIAIQRSGISNLFREDLLLLFFIQVFEFILNNARLSEQLTGRVANTITMIPYVEAGRVKSENFHHPDQILQRLTAVGLIPLMLQGIVDELQVVEELLTGQIPFLLLFLRKITKRVNRFLKPVIHVRALAPEQFRRFPVFQFLREIRVLLFVFLKGLQESVRKLRDDR